MGVQRNVGPVDRVVRGVVAVSLLSLLVTAQSDARWLGLMGLLPLATALVGWCPTYALFGANAVCEIKPGKARKN
jgi:hypothetical protein